MLKGDPPAHCALVLYWISGAVGAPENNKSGAMKQPFLWVLFLLFAAPSAAQDFPFSLEVPFPEIEAFNPAIPTPEEVLGHQIGSKHTYPHEVVDYFRAVAAASDRVTVAEHSRSYEGRPLIYATVTSPTNHNRLSELRLANRRVSSEPDQVTDPMLDSMPVVLYQGYSVHGNEASGTEAAVLYLYYLAAGTGDWIDDALSNAVVMVDPMFNPDGRDRFTDWVNRNRGAAATTDSNDREHSEPWPGGRTNHYWFDLNRDWLPAQHPESRGRLSVFHSWRPQVVTDHHEMGGNSSFFFQPGIPSRDNPNTPASTIELTGALAEHHAVALDAIGSGYYSQESFDDFYYGKGSTFPDINGAIGILFEQASSRALMADLSDGVLSYAFTVRNHFVTSISTLKGALANRGALLANQRSFYGTVPDFVRANRVKGYVVSLERGRVRAEAMAKLLSLHDIRAYDLAEDVDVNGMSFKTGSAYVLPLDQRQGRLLKAAFERTLEYGDSLFYDVSTWTLPLSHDLEYAEITSDVSALLGGTFEPTGRQAGTVVGGTGRYAYLIPWDQQYAARAAYRLQLAGVALRIAKRPFSARVGDEVHWFERGTIIAPTVSRHHVSLHQSGPDVHSLVREASQLDYVNAFAVDTGLTPSGPDLGGQTTAILQMPRVAILTGPGTSGYNAGEIWHLLSEEFAMPVSLLDVDRVGSADLSRYTTIVMAGGGYGNLDSDAVKSWIRRGGRLIVQDSGVGWAVRNELLSLEEKEMELAPLLEGVPFEDVSTARGAQAVGGSIFGLDLDTTHPVAYGLPETLPVFRQGNTLYEAPHEAGQSIGVYASEGILSGYISEEKLEDLPGSAGVVVTRMGGGFVTAFMDRVYFRAFWHGSSRLMTNAIFLGSAY